MDTDYSPETGDGSASKVPRFLQIVSNPAGIHRLRLPTEFTRRHGHNLADRVSLKVPSGLVWKVELIRDSDGETWLHRGWQQFEECYSIHFGHLLLFEYVGNSHFEVHIFDTTTTEIEYFHYDSLDSGLNQAAEAEGIESDSDDSVLFLKEIFTGKGAKSKDRDDVDDTRCNVSVELIDNHRPSRWEKKRRMQESDELHHVKSRKCSRTSPHYLYDAILLADKCSEGTKSKYSDRKRDVYNRVDAYTRASAFMSEKPTRKPFSVVLMRPSYVNPKYSLRIPAAFAREVLPAKENSLILHVSEGKTTWPVRCIRGSARERSSLTSGWKKFVEDNDLKVGDACVFEVVERINLTWNVIIFRG